MRLTNTEKLDERIQELSSEMNVVTEMINGLIAENRRVRRIRPNTRSGTNPSPSGKRR